MGYKVNFLDNTRIDAADLNAVASGLGGTASEFVNDTVYGVDDLNDISSTLISKGVTQGCTLSAGVDAEDPTKGTATIASGILFMGCGKRVIIDSDGVTLSFTVGSVYYVYFNHDATTGFVAPCISTTKPTTGDFVLLGTISETGQATAMPDKAVMKNSFLGLNKAETFTFSLPGGGTSDEILLIRALPSNVGYKRAILYSPGYENKQAFCGFVDFSSSTAFSSLCRFTYESGTSNGYNAFSQSRTDGRILAGIESCTGAQNWHYLYLRPVMTSSGTVEIYKQLVMTGIGGSMSAYTRTVTLILC